MKRVAKSSVQRKRGLITKAKRAFAALAIAGMITSCYGSTPREVVPLVTNQERNCGEEREERNERPAETEMPFDFDISQRKAPDDYCKGFPEIKEFSHINNLDPLFVRALIATESGFDSCAVVKACSTGNMLPGCFEPGPAQDTGYDTGFKEMHDPDGRCALTNAPGSHIPIFDHPDHKFVALGLMQTLEPPYTYWPANHRTDNADGPYFEVFRKSFLYPLDIHNANKGPSWFNPGPSWFNPFKSRYSPDIKDAKECNPKFNPFNSRDSVCLGTKKLSDAMRFARAWVLANRELLNWDSKDTEKDRVFTMYVATHVYAGTWQSSASTHTSRMCGENETKGDCWMIGFSDRSRVDSEYCNEDAGKLPYECVAPGVPRYEPPHFCYGVTDVMQYMRDCEMPLSYSMDGIGQRVMEMYYRLRNTCR